jgi:hypothetical protein
MTNAKELKRIVEEARENREAQERKAVIEWVDRRTDAFKALAKHEKTEERITVPSDLKIELVKELLEENEFKVFYGYSYRELFVKW